MPSTKDSESHRKRYQEAFRRNCHALMAMAYARLDCHSFQHSEEPTITGKLVEAMKEVQQLENAPAWAILLSVADDPPQNVEGRVGKRRRRIDIEIERHRRGRWPRFRFEAKRLYNSSSVAAYLGEEGLKLFVKGVYAPDDDEAGMLGYVQTESCSIWSERVGDRLASSPEDYHLRPEGTLQRAQLVSRLKDTHCSSHYRPKLDRPIVIFHTFLLFS